MNIYPIAPVSKSFEFFYVFPRFPGTSFEIRDSTTKRSDRYDGSDARAEYAFLDFIFTFRYD